MATTWATWTGWYTGSTSTETPTRMRVVTAAAQVSTVKESKHSTTSSVLLVTQRSWNPSSSARWATWRTIASGIGSGERWGSDIPRAVESARAMARIFADAAVGMDCPRNVRILRALGSRSSAVAAGT